MKEQVDLLGHKVKEEGDYNCPVFYANFFEECLEKLEDEKTDDVQWLTTVLLGAQIMRTQISDCLDQDFKEEVNAFLDFSLNGRYDNNGITKEDIDLSKDFVQQTVERLSSF